MSYRIERGVPMPKARAPRVIKYPFAKMRVGDSFLIPTKDLCRHAAHSVRGAARARGMQASVRKVAGGVLVWRVR